LAKRKIRKKRRGQRPYNISKKGEDTGAGSWILVNEGTFYNKVKAAANAQRRQASQTKLSWGGAGNERKSGKSGKDKICRT